MDKKLRILTSRKSQKLKLAWIMQKVAKPRAKTLRNKRNNCLSNSRHKWQKLSLLAMKTDLPTDRTRGA
jgi:hypothetical protein